MFPWQESSKKAGPPTGMREERRLGIDWARWGDRNEHQTSILFHVPRWNESEADIVATAGAEAVCDAAVCRRRCRRLGDGEWESKRARLRAMQ
jgi:hypothetical protein